MTPEARADLAVVIRHAEATGKDLSYRPHLGKKKVPSESAAIRFAIHIAAAHLSDGDDARRLKGARTKAKIGQEALAKLLGYEHRSSVGNVEVGRAPLDGRLLAWVMEQEAKA